MVVVGATELALEVTIVCAYAVQLKAEKITASWNIFKEFFKIQGATELSGGAMMAARLAQQ